MKEVAGSSHGSLRCCRVLSPSSLASRFRTVCGRVACRFVAQDSEDPGYSTIHMRQWLVQTGDTFQITGTDEEDFIIWYHIKGVPPATRTTHHLH